MALKDVWTNFVNTYTAFGEKKEVVNEFVEGLKKKGFTFNDEQQWWVRTWSTPTPEGEDRCLEVYKEDQETSEWKSIMYGSSGDIGNTCSCLDTESCVVVGFNDSWYNPFDYYGEVWWNFIPPEFDEIVEARLYVQGAQCDVLPVYSESNASIRNNGCSWNGGFQVTVIPHTLKLTNLINLKKGNLVNIEFDMVGKYLNNVQLK